MRREFHILVVEDNPADALLIEEAFKECGYRCEFTFAPSHAEGKKLLANSSFHLLISDYGGSEHEKSDAFIRTMRQDHPLIPIVVFSGHSDPRSAYKAGANAFIPKVSSWADFVRNIRDTMHFWIDVAKLPLPRAPQ